MRSSATRAERAGSSRSRFQWFLAVAAAVAITGGGVLAAERLGDVDPDEVVVGDGGGVSTSITPEPPVDQTTTTGPVTTAATTPETTVDSAPTTTVAETTETTGSTPATIQQFGLVDDGLVAIDATTGDTTPVPFGTQRDEVLELIAGSIGEPLFDGPLEQCGRGPTDSINWGGLSVYVDSETGAVVGWLLGEAGEGPAVTTGNDIDLGTTVAELRSERPGVESAEGSLGWEFWDGTVGWFTSGPNDSDIIEALWGGEICVYR